MYVCTKKGNKFRQLSAAVYEKDEKFSKRDKDTGKKDTERDREKRIKDGRIRRREKERIKGRERKR